MQCWLALISRCTNECCATERILEIIGEALGKAHRADPGLEEAIPEIHLIVGMRNRLAHAYDDIENALIWDTAIHDVPVLREKLETYLADAGFANL
jgi:uncharacterized protein with HEPN domain